MTATLLHPNARCPEIFVASRSTQARHPKERRAPYKRGWSLRGALPHTAPPAPTHSPSSTLPLGCERALAQLSSLLHSPPDRPVPQLFPKSTATHPSRYTAVFPKRLGKKNLPKPPPTPAASRSASYLLNFKKSHFLIFSKREVPA